jgi:seryl-tRNA synthetase
MTDAKFVENVKKWLKLDDQIREYTQIIKECKELRKELEEEIINYMHTQDQTVVNMASGGTLRASTSKVKGAIKHEYIQQILTEFTKSQEEAKVITQAIINNRPLKERVYLKRNSARKTKDEI